MRGEKSVKNLNKSHIHSLVLGVNRGVELFIGRSGPNKQSNKDEKMADVESRTARICRRKCIPREFNKSQNCDSKNKFIFLIVLLLKKDRRKNIT